MRAKTWVQPCQYREANNKPGEGGSDATAMRAKTWVQPCQYQEANNKPGEGGSDATAIRAKTWVQPCQYQERFGDDNSSTTFRFANFPVRLTPAQLFGDELRGQQ